MVGSTLACRWPNIGKDNMGQRWANVLPTKLLGQRLAHGHTNTLPPLLANVGPTYVKWWGQRWANHSVLSGFPEEHHRPGTWGQRVDPPLTPVVIYPLDMILANLIQFQKHRVFFLRCHTEFDSSPYQRLCLDAVGLAGQSLYFP